MVLKKRQECGFYGYQFPVVPRAPRTVRKTCLIKNSVDDDELYAFELLATVAGKLLQESEGSASSNAAGKEELGIYKDAIKEEKVKRKAVRSDCIDRGSFIESVLISESAALERNLTSTLKELPHCESDYGCTSVVSSSDLLKKVGCDVKLETYTTYNAVGSITSKAKGKLYDGNLGIEAETPIEVLGKQTGQLNVANSSGSKEPVELYVNNTNMLINSASIVKLPLYRAYVPNASFPKHRNNVKIVSRDDDENYFRRTPANSNMKAYRPQSHIGYRRTRKMQTSKYWKAIPKLKDYEGSNTGRGVRSFYHKRKIIYARERYQHEVNSKRRRLGDQRATVTYDQEASSESISNCPEKAMKGDKCGTPAISHRAAGVPSSGVGHKVSLKSKDPHVKLSIKSFKVPELYIEVPETATVGSLKRTVMEAVTAILGGGLRVGVVLQGKKVRDDNRTLLQTGISRNENLENLGFTLEPSLLQVASPPSPKDPPLPYDSPQQSSRPQVPVLDSGFSNTSFDLAPVTKFDDYVESNHEVVPSVTDVSTEGSLPDSKVGILPVNAEALAVVPVNPKTKRSELSNRRTRRPFSVSEVEDLVEAVEKLGTGRWRDVKMRAFDDANHRTYVDLKDKWKTLVHTACIAPQQRRGEPVPQVLLDRVLGAHAYWSQHQPKQHWKHPSDPLKLAGEIGA